MEEDNKTNNEEIEEKTEVKAEASAKNEVKIDNNPDKFDVSKVTNKIKENPWIATTVVLALIVVFMFFRGGGITGNVISEDDAGIILTEHLNGLTGGGVEYISTEDIGSLYSVTVSYQDQEIPVFITKDGEYFVQGAVPITGDVIDTPTQGDDSTQQPVEVTKSDKPKVELFIWSYCPYGVQAQGPLAEVASLIEDADFEAVPYYDGHGAYETQQNQIQLCIQEIAPTKYWDYAAKFVEDIYPKCGQSRDIECDKTESVKLMKSLGIDDKKVMDCVANKGEELSAEASQKASAYGVTGSPTLIINGVKSNAARNADAYKSAVCSAFNDVPEECSTTLDSSAAAAAGNC